MPRNHHFLLSHEPLRNQSLLDIQPQHNTGPISFLNPTRAYYRRCRALDPRPQQSDDVPEDPPIVPQHEEHDDVEKQTHSTPKNEQAATSVSFKWRSRDNRKGRHALVIDPLPPNTDPSTAPYLTPPLTHTLRSALLGIKRMFTEFPYWDISWLVAVIFTLGSVVWVMNAFFVWLPFVDPSTEFPNEIASGGGITAFIGATIFEIGSVLLMVEAVNENRAGCFGWAIERVLEGEGAGKWRFRPDKKGCGHHHTNKKNFVGKGDVSCDPSPKNSTTKDHSISAASSASSSASAGIADEKASNSNDNEIQIQNQNIDPTNQPDPTSPSTTWTWFPSWHELTTNYLHELGFLASLSQLLGASIFWISGLTALPTINTALSTHSQHALDGAYWFPQILGGTGFIISGVLFMLETQRNWYTPAPTVLGWHIGLWNLIGAFGFTLCGALGPAYGNSGAQYQASLATFWGSWAFLVGSLVQWFECLDTHPVEERSVVEMEG